MSVSGQAGSKAGRKVVGSTRYTADLEAAGPAPRFSSCSAHLASARIRGIDTAAAKSAPGVIDVVTGADLPAVAAPSPEKPLAVGRVFYVGQPVVAVIAESETAALDAAALVEVDYEPLPPTVDAEAAMKEGAETVLDLGETADADDASMHGAGAESDSDEAPVRRPPNVSSVVRLKRGHTSAALAASSSSEHTAWPEFSIRLEPHVQAVGADGGIRSGADSGHSSPQRGAAVPCVPGQGARRRCQKSRRGFGVSHAAGVISSCWPGEPIGHFV